jgi:hypothetical protein
LPRLAAAALALVLGGCLGPTWAKPGVGPEEAAADYSQCNALAQGAVARDSNIDTDILASRGLDWQNSGTLGVHRATMASETSTRSADVLRSCMLAKGYTQKP